MLNSKDSKPRGLLVDYFFEFKEAVKNYKNFEEVAEIVLQQIKINPKFVLSCIHYNTKTKRFFIDITKFDQYSITVYNSFSVIFPEECGTSTDTFTDVEKFRVFLSEKLSKLSWSTEVNNDFVLSFHLVSYHNVASGGYGVNFNQKDLQNYFIDCVDKGRLEYFFDPYTLTPLTFNYSLSLSGVVLDTYIYALIENIDTIKRENGNVSDKNLYRLFLISGIKIDELSDNIKSKLQVTFKGEWLKLLNMDKLFATLREEVFSSFWVYEKFLNKEKSNLLPDQKWLSIFEDYNELDLLKKFRYISKILTGFGLKKFKAVNVLVGEE